MNVKATVNKEVFDVSKKTKKNKVNVSLFLVTINTNQSNHSSDPEVVARLPKLEKYLRAIALGLYKKHIISLLGVPKYKSAQLKELNISQEYTAVDRDKIISINSKSNIEQNNDDRGFLHMQTAIRIEHTTMIQIRTQKLREMVEAILRPVLTFNGTFRRPHVNVRGVPSTADMLFRYVEERI